MSVANYNNAVLNQIGGMMRLGAQKSELVEGAKIRTIYGQSEIIERHRHRYEMNDRFIPA